MGKFFVSLLYAAALGLTTIKIVVQVQAKTEPVSPPSTKIAEEEEHAEAVARTASTRASCPCDMTDSLPPELWQKSATARWLSHVVDWGVLSTHSSLKTGYPFGNPYSFVDGSCNNATGTPYFFGTFMDQSFIDMKSNPAASFTISEASLLSNSCTASTYADNVCKVSTIPGKYAIGGDPESPLCARLTLLGRLTLVTNNTDEWDMAKSSFYQRHPQIQSWPSNHDWTIAKLIVDEAWLIDYFGGATILTADEYYAAKVVEPTIDTQRMSKEGGR